MKQEGMTFDHDFCYFILLFSSLLKKEGREKENDVAKVIPSCFIISQNMLKKGWGYKKLNVFFFTIRELLFYQVYAKNVSIRYLCPLKCAKRGGGTKTN